MTTKTGEEVPKGWFHFHVGEARRDLELLVKGGGTVVVHFSEGEKTVLASEVLSDLAKCICESKDLKSCTCASFLYQDGKGVYHFLTHCLLVTMKAQGIAADRAVSTNGRWLEERLAPATS